MAKKTHTSSAQTLSLQKIREAFSPVSDKQLEEVHWNIDNVEQGYKLSKDLNILLTHYETPGRNERLEFVLYYLSQLLSKTMLCELKALHDHKGNLNVLFSDHVDNSTIGIWFTILQKAWDEVFEDPSCVCLYIGDMRIDELCVMPASKLPMYQGMRYKLQDKNNG